ncbi:MAG: aldehyde dehydrogenase family protein [Mycolicibacter algericus]|uniref:aldehyde dehydrogenase family protein n=1 Tax=Mycolicibacter algericus TaxID=1288388 RepID=UPI003C72BE09
MSETITIHCPSDGREVGRVATLDTTQVRQRIDAMREAQAEWEAMGPRGRAHHLYRWRDWLLANEQHLADVLQSETGKPRAEATIEAPLACDFINYFARNAERFLQDSRRKPHGPLGLPKKLLTVLRPHAVVGVISPWNFPLAMPAMDVVPALAAGAAVALKPSEVTPLSALELARGWREIGAPAVFDVLTGPGSTGAALVESVDFVQFTGSTSTGRAVAQQAAARLIPYSLELGGKDPAIVLADADLDRAVDGIAWGGLFNAGQVCVSIERVYVEAPIYDEFVARLSDRVQRLRQGADDRRFRFDVGPLATPAQRDLVERQVTDAVNSGAKALAGGNRGAPGNFFEPTVIVDVDHSMACMSEETFGPTLPVMKVADAAEAIRLANQSPYGLSATIWTGNPQSAIRLARQLQVGAVNVNDALANLFNFALPHSGWKSSGVGSRFGGADGVRKYTRQQAITVPRSSLMKRELMWYPYGPRKGKLVSRVLRLITARGLARFIA